MNITELAKGVASTIGGSEADAKKAIIVVFDRIAEAATKGGRGGAEVIDPWAEAWHSAITSAAFEGEHQKSAFGSGCGLHRLGSELRGPCRHNQTDYTQKAHEQRYNQAQKLEYQAGPADAIAGGDLVDGGPLRAKITILAFLWAVAIGLKATGIVLAVACYSNRVSLIAVGCSATALLIGWLTNFPFG